MICLKCDICGNAFDFGVKVPNHVQFTRIDSAGSLVRHTAHDICPDCYAAIKKTIDARRKSSDPFEDDLK